MYRGGTQGQADRKEDESAPSSNWAILCAQLMLLVTATRTHIWISYRDNEFAVKNAKSQQTFLVASDKPTQDSKVGLEWG